MEKTIDLDKDTKIGMGDLLIFSAHLLHETVDEMEAEVEMSAKTTLKNGKKYKTTIVVTECN